MWGPQIFFRSFLTESESKVRFSSVTWQSIINFVGKPVPEESTESPPVKRWSQMSTCVDPRNDSQKVNFDDPFFGRILLFLLLLLYVLIPQNVIRLGPF